MGDGYDWRVYSPLVPRSYTFMINFLRKKYICIRPPSIKISNSTWISKEVAKLMLTQISTMKHFR